MQVKAFDPSYGSGQAVTVTATATAVTLSASSNSGLDALSVACIGTQPIFIRVTDVSSTANATLNADYIILPNSKEVISKDPQYKRVSIIAPATGSTAYVIEGRGL